MIINGTLMFFSLIAGFTIGMMMGISFTLIMLYFPSMKRRVELLRWILKNRKKIAKIWDTEKN